MWVNDSKAAVIEPFKPNLSIKCIKINFFIVKVNNALPNTESPVIALAVYTRSKSFGTDLVPWKILMVKEWPTKFTIT